MKTTPKSTVTFDLRVTITSDVEPPADNFAESMLTAALDTFSRASVVDSNLQRYPVAFEVLSKPVVAAPVKEGEEKPVAVVEPAPLLDVVPAPPPAPEPTPPEPEPEPVPVAPKGKLPEDFPYHGKLAEAGVNTYHQLSKYANDYTEIPGIGPVAAEKITDALAQGE